MDRTELLKKLIVKTGLSMRAFSEKAGIPNTTLHSMLERGIGKAAVDNVIKVCKSLGITVEQLEEMAANDSAEIKEKPNTENQLETIAAHFEGEEFTKDDLDDIENFIKYVKSKKKK
jgi:predicted transcriptional regulator